MKINRLAMKNLNSLAGEFNLDFDESPLAEAGIFAITGSTGAGKTTILDAICVALYGQTPRLAPGSSAELLSRNSGECFAEVEFTVAQGRYRSRWSRRRARGRADGNLQPTAMELVEIGPDGERIIEDQVRQVIERVETLTGLDFARFTRSVMLAQGSFASFLKAKENERAELLERMTGTRIYSFISMAAYNRAKEEKARLDELAAVNAHLDLLPVEQLADLQATMTALEGEITAGEEVLRGLRDREATAVRYAALQEAIGEGEKELAAVRADEKEAEPELRRLALAQAARPLLAELRSFDAVTEQLAGLQAEALELDRHLDHLRGELERARETRVALDQEAAHFAKAAEEQERAIMEAEKIDQHIRHQTEALAIREQTITTIRHESGQLAIACRGRQQEFDQGVDRSKALGLKLQQRAVDAGLGHDLSLISEALRELANHRERYTANRREQERLSLALDRLSQDSERLRRQQATSAAALAALQGQLAESEKSYALLLQGRTSEELEQELAGNRQRLARLSEASALWDEKGRLRRELAVKEERRQAIIEELAQSSLRRQHLHDEKVHGEEVLALLEEKAILAARIANYEADRQCLVKGEPCPLCGAIEHPWLASGVESRQSGPADPDQGRTAVVDQRHKVQALIGEIGGLDGRVLEREAALEALTKEIALSTQGANALRTELSQKAAAVRLSDPSLIPGAKAALETRIEVDQARQAAIRKAQAENDSLLRQLMAAEKAGATVVVELEKVLALSQENHAALTRTQGEKQTLCRQGVDLSGSLAPQLEQYGIMLPGPGMEEEISQLLRQRWQQYDQTRQERVGLEAQLAEWRQTLAVLTSQQGGLVDRETQEKAAALEISQAIEVLAKSRYALLQEQRVESARQKVAESRAAITSRLGESDGIRHGLLAQLATQTELVEKNRIQTARLAAEVENQSRALNERLTGFGFTDLAALRQALLPEEEFDALTEMREAIAIRRRRVEDRLQESRGQLAGLGQEAAALDGEAIRAALIDTGEALSRQQQELGARREQIHRQFELAEEHRQRSLTIECQRQELRRWQLLSDLVGSADGKKFRRFAQGLTLDHLIALANRQLVRLSDRYLLRRHQGEELGLEIMDTYQADAIRPTGTLSGGEEFLVSLALALGLANLSGQTRIDSLFLDEGFGSLDTDTLETALAALAALQETGKTIGIISHVDALKERIPVQIKLQKLAGGFSTMTITD
jgi:exonuclease SbcC